MEDVLHAIRVKGIASRAAVGVATGRPLEEVDACLAESERRELAFQRPSKKRPGWVLTESGREHHAHWLREAHTAHALDTLAGHYDGFLAVNSEVKGVSARWQSAPDEAMRFDLMDRIEALHEQAAPVLQGAAFCVPRYGRYGERLRAALEKLEEDPRYFVSPLVDSYHTVWFECHEDFLLTLGRTRAGEGSQ